jgi:hypothetical protein
LSIFNFYTGIEITGQFERSSPACLQLVFIAFDSRLSHICPEFVVMKQTFIGLAAMFLPSMNHQLEYRCEYLPQILMGIDLVNIDILKNFLLK